MSIDIKRKGNYETFKTTKGHKILVLDEKEYYAWVDTAQGHILVRSDADHQREKLLNSGDYVLAIPHDEPTMREDMGHLELKEAEKYHTYILPNGLPDSKDEQKKIISTDEYVSVNKVDEWIH